MSLGLPSVMTMNAGEVSGFSKESRRCNEIGYSYA